MPRANRRRGRLWRQHRAACSRGLTLVRLLFYAWLCRNRIVLGLPAFAGPCIRDSKHPWVAFFHIFFRSLALFAYGFGTYFSSNFVLIFVCCILLLAMDFWTGALPAGTRHGTWPFWVDCTG